MTTRRALLEKHNNDYGFNPEKILEEGLPAGPPLSFTVVIPYYETGEVFVSVLHHLYRSIRQYGGNVEVIVVDDGSAVRPCSLYVNEEKFEWLKLIVHDKNLGRTDARNTGLREASGEIVLFLDSDILIDDHLILNHAKLHLASIKSNRKSICVSFFEFIEGSDDLVSVSYDRNLELKINDFRIECTYGPTWISCEDDKQFIGQQMRLVKETNSFRGWRGKYKAWMLPNMILGGAFSVWRDEIIAVGGFDVRFKGYGFTETSAVTRLVAERNNVVVPCLSGGGLHMDDSEINVSRVDKDRIFKEKHAFYFDVFLEEEV